MKLSLLRPLSGLLITAALVLHGAGQLPIPGLGQMENSLYDMRLRYTASQGIDPRVVIVDIDEASLGAHGQWPWRRDLVSRLIETLFERYRIEVLGLDVVFAEPDIDATLDALKSLDDADLGEPGSAVRRLAGAASRDEVLAATLDRYNVVMGYTFRSGARQDDIGLLPAPLFSADKGLAALTRATRAQRYTANVPVLQGERSGGFFSLFNGFDSDGILRRAPLLNVYQEALYPSLSLAVATNYLGLGVDPVITQDDGAGDYTRLEGLDLGLHQVTIDPQARIPIPFRHSSAGNPGFRYISAMDILNETVSAEADLANTVALLGTSAAGLTDLRATPVSTVLPGVEVHANLIAALMDGNFLRAPGWRLGVEALVLAAVGVVLALILPRLNATRMTLVAGLALGAGIACNFWLWQSRGLILELAPLVMLIGALYLLNVIWGYLLESRSRIALKRSFGLYVPPEIIDNMQGQSIDALLRSEKKELTVLFTDVRGFTTISETLSPQDLSELMNRFLTPMTAIVHRHGGAIDKYMGDAMMAFWGAPLDAPDHASRALDAAVEMCEALDDLNAGFIERGWPRIRIGVGLNTGEMNVGNMGSAFRMAYTVLGDAVNLGARLEALTKTYGVSILISEATAAACPQYLFCELDRVRVQGKRESVRIMTPLGLRETASEADHAFRERFERGLTRYRDRQWEEARTEFIQLVGRSGERAAFAQPAVHFYLGRIDHLISHPPGDDWDSIYVFETK